MNLIYWLIGTPLGWLMWAIFQVVGNYGVALLLLTVVVNSLMIPISIRQQKSTAKMQAIQPEMTALQEKYKGNQQKLQEEMQKLYDREKYNPMSGCLPMLIQMPILFGMIDVVYKPLKHILRLPEAIISMASGILAALGIFPATASFGAELAIIGAVREMPQAFLAIGAETIAQIQSLPLDFLGIDLTVRPDLSMITGIFSGGFHPAVLIPILSGITAFASSIISMRNTPQTAANASMKGMMLTMPLFSLWFSFQVAAGVGLYWVFSNLYGIVRILVMNKYYNPKEMAEKAKQEMEARREEARQDRIEARKKRLAFERKNGLRLNRLA